MYKRPDQWTKEDILKLCDAMEKALARAIKKAAKREAREWKRPRKKKEPLH